MTVAYGAGSAGGVLHKIEFIHFVTVSRVLKIGLMTIAHIEDI
jgi:hypothetical protein